MGYNLCLERLSTIKELIQGLRDCKWPRILHPAVFFKLVHKPLEVQFQDYRIRFCKSFQAGFLKVGE